jgi:hypothetical protein
VRRITSAEQKQKESDATTSGKEDETRAASAVEAGETSLISCVILQRKQFNDASAEVREFDAQWGVGKVGGEVSEYSFLPTAEEAIKAELKAVELEAAAVSEALSNYSLHSAGVEILHLFMLDLLGRNTAAAKIFREKSREEFPDHHAAVSALQKYAATSLLLSLNAYFLYFILQKGMEKSQAWQLQYLICTAIQVAISVLVLETAECAWLNFIVPRTVLEEVRAAAIILTATAAAVADPRRHATSRYFLHAPAHLFVSARVSKAHPQLPESLIVRSYANHLPGPICHTWPHYKRWAKTTADTAVTGAMVTGSLAQSAILAGQSCLTIPYLYQRILLRFLLPLVFSAVGVLWFSIIHSPAAMAAVGSTTVACAMLICWLRRTRQRASRLNSVLPIAADCGSFTPMSVVALSSVSGSLTGSEHDSSSASSWLQNSSQPSERSESYYTSEWSGSLEPSSDVEIYAESDEQEQNEPDEHESDEHESVEYESDEHELDEDVSDKLEHGSDEHEPDEHEWGEQESDERALGAYESDEYESDAHGPRERRWGAYGWDVHEWGEHEWHTHEPDQRTQDAFEPYETEADEQGWGGVYEDEWDETAADAHTGWSGDRDTFAHSTSEAEGSGEGEAADAEIDSQRSDPSANQSGEDSGASSVESG